MYLSHCLLDKQLNINFRCDHCVDIHCAKCLIGLQKITMNDAATASAGYRCESCRPKGVGRGQVHTTTNPAAHYHMLHVPRLVNANHFKRSDDEVAWTETQIKKLDQ